jgi:Anti-sigma-K factor rskA
VAGTGALSPAARAALMRRRVGGGLAAVVVIALLVFGGIKIFGGGSSHKSPSSKASTTTGAAASQNQRGQVVAQAVLAPIGKSFKGTGAALVYQSGNQALAVVRAKLPPSSGNKKYVLWLFDSDKQLVPLAADVTDKQGNFQGAAALPGNWASYRFVDLTYQATSGKKVGHGQSVMRGPLTAPSQPTGTGTSTSTGTTTTP